ncbi:polysaccharide pyruvyl transferase family protein [Pseudomonas sp. PGPR40]|uniref:polysaccharide pyruvyl transferase family protein n=1 Tax=Pseudomonas sp. PGPR40 TaxID=2913476 RepID=UPI001EDAE4E1|nr:polysaccharide pyruvyl transferase family protein [Pseudomonas sp. PGPR40]
MKLKKIYFEPAGQIENTGDLLINKVALDLVRKYGEIIVNDNDTPRWFVDEITGGNDTLASSSNSSLFASIFFEAIRRRSETYLLLPPGDISRKGMKSSIGTIVKSSKLFILRLVGCKIIRLGFSIGPFDKANAISESIQSFAYRVYGVRDSHSLKFGKDIRINNLIFFPDFSWYYKPDTDRLGTFEHENHIVLSFRSNANGIKHDSSYLEKIKEILSRFLAENPSSSKVTICYQVAYDREGCRDLYDELRKKNHHLQFEFIDKKLSLSECNEIYSKSSLVISNRLHVLMLAAINGAKIIALTKLGHNKKIANLFADNRIDACIVNSLEDTDQCTKKLRESVANSKQTQLNFESAVEQNRMRIDTTMSAIFN